MQTPNEETRPEAVHVRERIGRRLKALCTDLGIGERDQNAWLQSALGIGYSSVWRKLSGEAAWTDADLALVASAANMCVEQLLLFVAKDEAWTTGTLLVAGRPVECDLLVGDKLPPDHDKDMVATQRGQGWEITSGEDAAGEDAWGIVAAQLRPRPVQRPRIAVLEDDAATAEAAATLFTGAGFQARVFPEPKALVDALRAESFGAFVVDWWLKGVTAEATIAEIRSQHEHRSTPIIIVTGELSAGGNAEEADLSRVLKAHRCTSHMKPVRWRLVAAELAAELGPAGGCTVR